MHHRIERQFLRRPVVMAFGANFQPCAFVGHLDPERRRCQVAGDVEHVVGVGQGGAQLVLVQAARRTNMEHGVARRQGKFHAIELAGKQFQLVGGEHGRPGINQGRMRDARGHCGDDAQTDSYPETQP